MTSSMTAAPRTVAPSRERSAPISPNDREQVWSRMERPRLGGGNERPPEHVQRCRAEDQAGKDFTEDRRLPDSVREVRQPAWPPQR
jgi:hypothetical protein